MDTGGIKHSHNELSKATGVAKVMFVGSSGDPVELHRRTLRKGDPWLLATNDLDEVRAWAHQFFQRAIDEKRDAYLGLKDTVIPGYDGVMREAIEASLRAAITRSELQQAGLNYHYELIDAQAARIVANPPQRALWGVPDNTTGRKLFKLVNELKNYGIPSRKHHVSLSRMSAGGGDQYGSFNMPVQEDGIIKVIVDGEEKHARDVQKGDPSCSCPMIAKRLQTGSARCFAMRPTRTRKCISVSSANTWNTMRYSALLSRTCGMHWRNPAHGHPHS